MSGQDARVRPLGAEKQIHAKGAALTGQRGQHGLDFGNLLLLLLAGPGFVQDLRKFIHGEDTAGEVLPGLAAVFEDVPGSSLAERRFPRLQFHDELLQDRCQFFRREHEAAVLAPCPVQVVHRALEVHDKDHGALAE